MYALCVGPRHPSFFHLLVTEPRLEMEDFSAAWKRRRHVRPLAARWLGCGAWRGGDNLNAAPINRVNGRDLVQFHPNSEARTGPWRDSVLGLSSVVFIQWRKILTILQSVYFSPSNLQWFQSNSIHHYHMLNTIHRSISSSPILLHM